MVIKSDFRRMNMNFDVIQGILIPFVGTTLGAGSVFVMKRSMNTKIRGALSGFAGGVMIAASIWSLIIPAIEGSASLGSFAFFPACVGFLLGIFSLLALDKAIPSRA